MPAFLSLETWSGAEAGHRAGPAALLTSQPDFRSRPMPMSAVLSDPIPASPDERIAALLLQRGKLKDADLARARRLQEETGGDLLALLALGLPHSPTSLK